MTKCIIKGVFGFGSIGSVIICYYIFSNKTAFLVKLLKLDVKKTHLVPQGAGKNVTIFIVDAFMNKLDII